MNIEHLRVLAQTYSARRAEQLETLAAIHNMPHLTELFDTLGAINSLVLVAAVAIEQADLPKDREDMALTAVQVLVDSLVRAVMTLAGVPAEGSEQLRKDIVRLLGEADAFRKQLLGEME